MKVAGRHSANALLIACYVLICICFVGLSTDLYDGHKKKVITSKHLPACRFHQYSFKNDIAYDFLCNSLATRR